MEFVYFATFIYFKQFLRQFVLKAQINFKNINYFKVMNVNN